MASWYLALSEYFSLPESFLNWLIASLVFPCCWYCMAARKRDSSPEAGALGSSVLGLLRAGEVLAVFERLLSGSVFASSFSPSRGRYFSLFASLGSLFGSTFAAMVGAFRLRRVLVSVAGNLRALSFGGFFFAAAVSFISGVARAMEAAMVVSVLLMESRAVALYCVCITNGLPASGRADVWFGSMAAAGWLVVGMTNASAARAEG